MIRMKTWSVSGNEQIDPIRGNNPSPFLNTFKSQNIFCEMFCYLIYFVIFYPPREAIHVSLNRMPC